MLHCHGKAAKMDPRDLETRLLKRLGLVSLLSLTIDFVGLGTGSSVDPDTHLVLKAKPFCHGMHFGGVMK